MSDRLTIYSPGSSARPGLSCSSALSYVGGARLPWNTSSATLSVSVAVLLHAILFSYFSILRHDTFNSAVWDLAIFDNVIWNSSHGRWLETSFYEFGSYMGEHFSPVLVLLVPVYWIVPDPRALLVAQSIWTAAGGLAMFALARHLLVSPAAAAVVAVAYLLHPTLSFTNLFDFHPETLLFALLPLTLLWLHQGRLAMATTAIAFSLLIKEDVAFAVFGLGLYSALVVGRRRVGALLCGGSVAYLLFCMYVAIPAFRGQPYFYPNAYGYLGTSAGEMVTTQLGEPGLVMAAVFTAKKAIYVTAFLHFTSYFAVFAPLALVAAAPKLLINMLSNHPAQTDVTYQYAAGIVPFVFAAGILGLRRVALFVWPHTADSNLQPPSVLLAVMWAMPLALLAPLLHAIPLNAAAGYFEKRVDLHVVDQAMGLVPPNASLAVSNHLGPHVSRRLYIQAFPDIRGITTEYVVYLPGDLTDKRHRTLLPGGPEEALLAANYKRMFERGTVEVWRLTDRAAETSWTAAPIHFHAAASHTTM